MNTLEKIRNKTTHIRPSRSFTLVLGLIVLSSIIWFSATTLQATSNFVPIDGWTSTTALPVAVGSLNAIEHNNNLYLIGGRKTDGTPTSQVYRSRINADGSLSTWTTTSALPQPLYLHSASATDTHIYVIGGWKGSTPVQKAVYRAAFTSDGGLSAWVNVQQDYPTDGQANRGIDLHGSVIVGNRIYGIGGFDGFNPLDTVHSAAIDSNGNLSAWRTERSLPGDLYRHAVLEHNGYIYVTGGLDQVAQSIVYYAKVNTNGTLGSWQTTTAIPTGVYYHRIVVHDGKLMLIAGSDIDTKFNTVYSAPLNGDGSIGSWVAEPSLPQSLERFSAVSVEKYGSDYVYIIGGISNGAVQTNVYHSNLPPTPTATNTPTPLPTATPTPTPTPPVSISASISNEPSHWVAAGEEITYTINYNNDGLLAVSDASISSMIPENTELVTSTVGTPPFPTFTASSSGSTLSWDIGTLAPSAGGSATYTVRRLPVPEPPDRVIDLEISGPTSAAIDEEITYTLSIENKGTELKNATVTVPLPAGSTYIGHSSNGEFNMDENKIVWTIETLEGLQTVDVTFTVSAKQTIIIKNYEASAEDHRIQPIIVTDSTETKILITDINGTPPTEPGDDIIITNSGTMFSWIYNGQAGNIPLDSVVNPTTVQSVDLNNYLFLPLVEN